MDSSRLLEQINLLSRNLPHRVLSKYITLALVVYLAYFVATMIWAVVPVQNSVGNISSASTVKQTTSANSGVDLSTLLSAHIFGEEGKVEVKKPVAKPTQAAPKTRLSVTLTGLVADSADPVSASSVAIIEGRNGQDTYGINDKISGTSASIYQIYIDRVILLVSGRYETLMLDGIEYSTKPPSNPQVEEGPKQASVKPAVKNATKKRERLDKRTDMELARSLREQRAQLFEDPKKLVDVIRIRPYKQKGELLGYRLSPGKDAKLFKQVGLKRNDLAISINGQDLTDMQQALTVMGELKTMTEATITVVRQDELIDIILAL